MTPETLQENVLRELRFDPRVDASKIGVAASASGVVTLTGTVSSYTEKLAAEEAAKRVYGVRAVASQIEVVLPNSTRRTDTNIAEAAVNALKTRAAPLNDIKVTVKSGWVTLEGEVDYYYQKEEAEKGLSSCRSQGYYEQHPDTAPRPSGEPRRGEKADRRGPDPKAQLDARRINVRVTDSKVILEGTVRSWAEELEAERAARAIPGIHEVENRLEVVP